MDPHSLAQVAALDVVPRKLTARESLPRHGSRTRALTPFHHTARVDPLRCHDYWFGWAKQGSGARG